MPKDQKKSGGPFDKVGECLYRYRPSGTYYARVKQRGKDIRQSLETRDRKLAKRRLRDFKRDLGLLDLAAGDLTLAELCERYFKTVLHQKPSTVQGKRMVIDRMLAHWPGSSSRRLKDVRTSEIREFLSASVGENGKSLYNHYVFVVRAVFDVALQDRLIATSPAADIKAVKRDKPIRRTPSFKEFQNIVEDIRSQAFNADCRDSADFVELLGLAGLGQAEASALRSVTSIGSAAKSRLSDTRPARGSSFPSTRDSAPYSNDYAGIEIPRPMSASCKLTTRGKRLRERAGV
jgi:hypothetical protein